jgi:hypothetical protein
MEPMKMHRLLIIAFTGIASPLLLLIALFDDGKRLGWLNPLLFGPGRFVAGMFDSNATPFQHSRLYFQIAFAMDFLFLWLALVIVALLLVKLITRRKQYA